eukprot:CAMPEP_0201284818 /NCGR_PEP_ID=MMETSP1317-20130820/85545_1 /ASSEMBLY_ACC=CAM_ASM_000770 /TAXON_ID=187299 /ORGANISM="Undescribed Undescribed, Strain Undescribed" /LENGTH=57 /DNA_ID=CAMNT_0047606477 /DNA_START=270 /DNA_END=443 /DNA_ORIENTATION=-
MDSLLDFTTFDETSGLAYIGEEVAIRKDTEAFVLLENGVEIVEVQDEFHAVWDDLLI